MHKYYCNKKKNHHLSSCTFMLLVIVNLELKYFPKNSTFLMLARMALSTPDYLAILAFLFSASLAFTPSNYYLFKKKN